MAPTVTKAPTQVLHLDLRFFPSCPESVLSRDGLEGEGFESWSADFADFVDCIWGESLSELVIDRVFFEAQFTGSSHYVDSIVLEEEVWRVYKVGTMIEVSIGTADICDPFDQDWKHAT